MNTDDFTMSSKINKRLLGIKNEGKCLITTLVSGVYELYRPMFLYCAKKAYPEYDVECLVRGKDIPDPIPERDNDGRVTACLRYLICPEHWTKYDYIYITDVDILIHREVPTLVDQHMMSMRRWGLICYDNYVSSYFEGEPRLAGVHFVTRDWWARTEVARERWLELLRLEGNRNWAWDEVMLARIVLDAGLPRQEKRHNLWAMHGIHLGDYRRRIMNNENTHPSLGAYDDMFVRQLDGDPEFMALFKEAMLNIPALDETWQEFKKHWC